MEMSLFCTNVVKLDPDPYSEKRLDPDPQKKKTDPQPWPLVIIATQLTQIYFFVRILLYKLHILT